MCLSRVGQTMTREALEIASAMHGRIFRQNFLAASVIFTTRQSGIDAITSAK